MNYDVRFCQCGRIHVMPYSEMTWMAKDCQNRSVTRVCANCGAAYTTFLSECEDGFDVNCISLKTGVTEFNNQHRIHYSKGITVCMKSGEEADTYQNGFFVNSKEWSYETSEKNLSYADKQRHDFVTVDTERLIREVEREYKEKADDILKAISGYAVKIHWEGTKYCKSFNT